MVVETKLDRLGRSTRELLDLIERIGKVGVVFRDQDHARSQYA
jgi:DNA invertase Pin-like site-specific DNA recombinase